MATLAEPASNVQISLSVDGDQAPNFHFPNRRILLDAQNPSVVIGRASKTPSKGFLAEPDNAWFNSEVMSRQHAEIKADFDHMKVEIKDLNSLHGTYLNDDETKISADEPCELEDGDSVRFGVGVWRGADKFAPTTVKVGIAFDHRNDRASSTFRVPDGSDDGSDLECLSNNSRQGPRTDKEPTITMAPAHDVDLIDLTELDPVERFVTNAPRVEGRVDVNVHNIIDLSSPPPSRHSPLPVDDDDDLGSDSDSVCSDASIRIHPGYADRKTISVIEDSTPPPDNSGFGLEFAEVPSSQYYSSGDDADALTDSEGECASSSRVGDHYDDDDMLRSEMDESDGELDDELDEDAEDYMNDDMDGELDDGLDGYLDDKGIGAGGFDWTAGRDVGHPAPALMEDDTSDEDDPRDPFWKVAQGSNNSPHPFSPTLKTPEPVNTGNSAVAQVEQSLKTSSVSISGLLNSDGPEAPRSALATTLPSMSAFPTSIAFTAGAEAAGSELRRHPSPSDVVMQKSRFNPAYSSTAEHSSLLAHNPDFFAAREANKVTIHLQRRAQMLSAVPPPPSAWQPLPSTQPDAATESLKVYEPYQANIITPPHEVPATKVAPQSGRIIQAISSITPPPTKPSKAEGSQNASDGSRRTYLGISDIVEGQAENGKSNNKGKGKRKADDISTLSPEEEEWVARETTAVEVPTPPESSSSESEPNHHEDMKVATPRIASPDPPRVGQIHSETSLAAIVTPPLDQRPAKRQRLRKIAERVGYAALGGVTAGAMIVGTLIYTAPNFA